MDGRLIGPITMSSMDLWPKGGRWGTRNLELRLMRYGPLAFCHPSETTKFENCSTCSPQIQVAYAPMVHGLKSLFIESKNMTTITNLFPSTRCNAEYIGLMAELAAADGYKKIVPEKYGYVLVGKRLVPYTFLERMKNDIDGIGFEYGSVLSEATTFSDQFLCSLRPDEREVLMPCLLILIERGDMDLNVLELTDEEKAA